MQKHHIQDFPVKKTIICFLILAIVTTLTYSNHFNNAFHFDDSHTIQNNLFIQDIKNIPLFFKDGTTFSTLPTNQSYRPIVSTSLAIDYWLGNGYNVFYFHLSTFIIFLLQGFLMFLMFYAIFENSFKDSWNFYIAAGAVAWYLLHPANAETVNYIIARSDIQSTFFVVLGFTLYLYSNFFKKSLLYLIPIAIGVLAKPTAVMFAPIFFFYILLFEQKISLFDVFKKANFSKLFSALKTTLPSFLICGIMYLLIDYLTPKTWISGGSSLYNYIITQPYVIVHYFTTFFLPIELSADTDWQPLESIWNPQFIIGCVFIFAMMYIVFQFSKNEKLRPISFGIIWFFLALIPTSIIPLSEVLNDHRIFFPYIGLTISVCWTLVLLIKYYALKLQNKFFNKMSIATIAILILSGYAYGTYQRNCVWKTEESLWYDVTIKSPHNGRGLMNYGLSKMGQGDYVEANKYFTRALEAWPRYSFLHINMGILKAATGDNTSAETFFKNGVEYGPNYPDAYFFYGRFLVSQSRHNEAIVLLTKAIELSPAHIGACNFLMNEYNETEQWDKLAQLATNTLIINPGNAIALSYLNSSKDKKGKIQLAEDEIKTQPTPEKYLNLSLLYYQAEKYQECIRSANEAIKLKKDYYEAYNNIGSAYNMLKQWDNAIAAFNEALNINPKSDLAKNNLLLALAGKNQLENTENNVKKNPTSDNYINLSLEYYNQGKYEKCIVACEAALKIAPNNANAYNNIAAAYCQLKEWKKAMEAANKALKIDPQHKLAAGNLNWAIQENNKLNK